MSFSGTGALAFGGSGARSLTLTGTNGGNNTFAPIIGDGSGGVTSLNKSGSGTWVLTGANTYAGATTISGGTLKVNGSTAAGSAVAVNSGGTLAGSGSVNGTVAINSGGTLSPGNSPGTINTGATGYNGGGTDVWEINNATGIKGADPGWDWNNIAKQLSGYRRD